MLPHKPGMATKDYYFPRDSIDETVSLNGNFKLKVYGGKGHMSTMDNKQFAIDVLEFLR